MNLLVDDDEQWTLVDRSAAVIADPHYDLAFTTLILANPPLGGPAFCEPGADDPCGGADPDGT